MPFVRRLSKILPAMGVARQDPLLVREDISLSGSTTEILVPENPDLRIFPPISEGYVRVKIGDRPGENLNSIKVYGYDAADIWEKLGYSVLLDEEVGWNLVCTFTYPFLSEYNPIRFLVEISGGAGALASVEIAGTSGDLS